MAAVVEIMAPLLTSLWRQLEVFSEVRFFALASSTKLLHSDVVLYITELHF